jgi:hypothetical protein
MQMTTIELLFFTDLPFVLIAGAAWTRPLLIGEHTATTSWSPGLRDRHMP